MTSSDKQTSRFPMEAEEWAQTGDQAFVNNSHLVSAALGAYRLYIQSRTYFLPTIDTSPFELLVDLMIFAFPAVAYYQYRLLQQDRGQDGILLGSFVTGIVVCAFIGGDYAAALLGYLPACLWSGLVFSTIYYEGRRQLGEVRTPISQA